MTVRHRFTRVRRLAGVLLVGLIAFSLTACQAGPATGTSSAPDEATIGLTYIPNIQFAPFYVADHDKAYANAAITLRHHGASEGLFTALIAGEEQFVVAGGDEILQARSQGVDIIAIGSYYSQYPSRLIVPADSDITAMADLRGKTIGIPGRFGENWFAVLIGLKQAGLTDQDVTISEIGYTQQVALTTGKVDAVIGFSNSDVISFEMAGVPIRVIDPKLDLVSICLATTTAYAKAHPDTVAAVIHGMRQGMTTAAKDPTTTLTIAADYIPNFRGETVTTAEKILPATTQLFSDSHGTISPDLDPAQWRSMSEAMTSVGLLASTVDPSVAMSNDYA
ncbi:MAG: ABC transporter substrate-binding protein [Propionibacteriaceae bacterium]|jgi:NitT/TauT family transport system substrate-binding protein|nr:ABC transporter substrate-binding protein [Propionibacteriaceae bacterium]